MERRRGRTTAAAATDVHGPSGMPSVHNHHGENLERSGYGALPSPATANNATTGAARRRRPKSALRRRGGDDNADAVAPIGPGSGGRKKPARHNLLSLARSKSAERRRSNNKTSSRGGGASASASAGRATSAGRQRWGGMLRRRKAEKAAAKCIQNNDVSVCDYCHGNGKGKKQMHRRDGNAYCSTNCMLQAAAAKMTSGGTKDGDAMNFAESGFASPPITPSAKLIQQQQHQRGGNDSDNDSGTVIKEKNKQFFPSSTAPSNSDDDGDLDSKFKWYEQNDNRISNSRSRSLETADGSGSFVINPTWSSNQNDDARSDKRGPSATNASAASIQPDYGRGISDEYRDYNDELSRQLRLAARQDELEAEERRYQSRQFSNAHHHHPNNNNDNASSPGRLRLHVPVTNYSPGKHSNVSRSGNANAVETSPGRYRNSNRRKYPTLTHQYENATQSTESVSSSSMGAGSHYASKRPTTNGGAGRNGIGRTTAPSATAPGTTSAHSPMIANNDNAPPRSSAMMRPIITANNSTASDNSSWGYLDVGRTINNSNNSNNNNNNKASIVNDDNSWAAHSKNTTSSEVRRAFEGLSGWPREENGVEGIEPPEGIMTDGSGMGDGKTPRSRQNLSLHRKAGHDGGGKNGNSNDGAKDDQKRKGVRTNVNKYKTPEKRYERHASSLSSTPSLLAISEEQSFGMMDQDPEMHNEEQLLPKKLGGFQFLAQKRGLRSIAKVDHDDDDEIHRELVINGIVSVSEDAISYYDDPSVDMMSSLATNDTLTTASGMYRGGGGSPTMITSDGPAPKGTIVTRTKRNSAANVSLASHQHRQHRPPRSLDPPGNSIDELLKGGIRSGGAVQHEDDPRDHRPIVRRYQRDPSLHDLSHGLEPSFHGMEPEDEEQLMAMIREEEEGRELLPQEVFSKQRKSRSTPQKQHQQRGTGSNLHKYPQQQQQQREQRRVHYEEQGQQRGRQSQIDEGASPGIRPPPRLHTTAQQEWKWTETVPPYDANTEREGGHHHREPPGKAEEPHFGPEGERGPIEFDVGNIEFPTPEKLEVSLTGDEYDDDIDGLPPTDDDTVANTLDTVDLVAEVKRVWRHVQRYETKKQKKKEARRRYSNSNGGKGRGVDKGRKGNGLDGVDEEDAIEQEEEEDDDQAPMKMDSLIQQFEGMQTSSAQAGHHHQQHQHQDGDYSKFSDITPSSPHHDRHILSNDNARGNNDRGRSSERLSAGNDGGRLGNHIRSTSAHSRQHATPNSVPCDSPGLVSDHAMTSRASSTERDLEFLNEGVDEFYQNSREEEQEQEEANLYRDLTAAARRHHSNHRGEQPSHDGEQQQQPKAGSYRSPLMRRRFLNNVLQSKESMGPPSQEEEGGHISNDGNDKQRLLSKPYDMAKTRSTGTSFTQNTQKISNTTTSVAAAPSSALRSEMAKKYMRHKDHQHGVSSHDQFRPVPNSRNGNSALSTPPPPVPQMPLLQSQDHRDHRQQQQGQQLTKQAHYKKRQGQQQPIHQQQQTPPQDHHHQQHQDNYQTRQQQKPVQQQQQQQQGWHNHNQQQQQIQKQQRPTPTKATANHNQSGGHHSGLYSKAIQDARERRMHNNGNNNNRLG